jgi:carbon starvation protein CstA
MDIFIWFLVGIIFIGVVGFINIFVSWRRDIKKLNDEFMKESERINNLAEKIKENGKDKN